MGPGEILLGLALLKALASGKGDSSTGSSSPPADAPPKPPEQTASEDFTKGAIGAGASLVTLGTTIVETLSSTGTATIGGAVGGAAAAALEAATLQATAESAIEGAIQGAAGAAAEGAFSAAVTAFGSALIAAAAVILVMAALSALTNAAIAEFFAWTNRQAQKNLGWATYQSQLEELETRWAFKLIPLAGGVPNNSTSQSIFYDPTTGTQFMTTRVVGVTWPPEPPRTKYNRGQISRTQLVDGTVAAASRYLAMAQMRAHNTTVLALFSSTLPNFNPKEYFDAVPAGELETFFQSYWLNANSWGTTMPINIVQASLDFGVGYAADLARFYGKESAVRYSLKNLGNATSYAFVPCTQKPTPAAQSNCISDTWFQRLGLGSMRQVGSWPERFYIDDAAGLALGFQGGFQPSQLRRKSKRVAELLAGGHYVPPALQVILNNEDAGLSPRLPPFEEIARQSQFDATPWNLRVPS